MLVSKASKVIDISEFVTASIVSCSKDGLVTISLLIISVDAIVVFHSKAMCAVFTVVVSSIIDIYLRMCVISIHIIVMAIFLWSIPSCLLWSTENRATKPDHNIAVMTLSELTYMQITLLSGLYGKFDHEISVSIRNNHCASSSLQ